MNIIRKLWIRFRSVVTGRFVSKSCAEANPDTTIGESHDPHHLHHKEK